MFTLKKLTAHEKYMINQHQLEIELGRLRKEWAVLEKSRASNSFLKYAKVVELYKKEHENIQNDLMRAKDPGRKKEDSKVCDALCLELVHYDYLDDTVKKEKEYIKEVENEIKTVKKSVNQLSKQQVTDRQHQDRVWAIMKTIEALENKLETQMIKFGTICTKNSQMRQEIDHLLWERRNFLQQWHKFINKLSDGKHIMLDLIEQATIAYNQREEWCSKLQALRIKAHQDLLANMHEMREFIRKHDQNMKLEEFFMIKGQKRQMRDLKEKVKQKRVQRQQELTEKLDRYKTMMADIKTFTKEHKIDNIANKFVVQDEYNLSKFKYVVDLLHEMENISDRLGTLHLDIEEKNILYNSRRHQQQKCIERLEEQLERCSGDSRESSEMLNDTEDYLHRLLEGVSSLFKLCKCDQDPLLRLLGANDTVTNFNVTFYIDILESKVQELLVATHYQSRISMVEKKSFERTVKTEDTAPRLYTIESIVKVTPCSLCVEHEMVADVIDVLQHPLTRENAIQKLNRRLNTPGGLARLHTISNCQLPQSRGIIQKRYQ